MASTELLVTPEEFRARVVDFAHKEHLIFFLLHQRTKQLSIVQISELEVLLEKPLAWQEDLWCAKEAPTNPSTSIPAKNGWLLLNPPFVYDRKLLSIAYFGIQPYWLDEREKREYCNLPLKDLYGRFRKALIKNTVFGKVSIRKTQNILDNAIHAKLRYSPKVLELQKDGWSFIEGRRIKGPFYTIDTEEESCS